MTGYPRPGRPPFVDAVYVACALVIVICGVALGIDLVNGGLGDCADDLLWAGSCK